MSNSSYTSLFYLPPHHDRVACLIYKYKNMDNYTINAYSMHLIIVYPYYSIIFIKFSALIKAVLLYIKKPFGIIASLFDERIPF